MSWSAIEAQGKIMISNVMVLLWDMRCPKGLTD